MAKLQIMEIPLLGMRIGGLQKTTLIDYPGKVACTVFLMGCNFRCPWCYSSELVLPEKIKVHPQIPLEDFFIFLKKRQGQLEGVVICGGEPTINPDLPGFCNKIKQMGYAVKLDTNGSNFEMLKELVERGLVDYVAMDVKAPKAKYFQVIGVGVDDYLVNIEESIAFLKRGLVDYEFRTTFVPQLLTKEDIVSIAQWLGPAKRYYLQNFRPEKTLDPAFAKLKPHPDEEILSAKEAAAAFFEVCAIR